MWLYFRFSSERVKLNCVNHSVKFEYLYIIYLRKLSMIRNKVVWDKHYYSNRFTVRNIFLLCYSRFRLICIFNVSSLSSKHVKTHGIALNIYTIYTDSGIRTHNFSTKIPRSNESGPIGFRTPLKFQRNLSSLEHFFDLLLLTKTDKSLGSNKDLRICTQDHKNTQLFI